MKNVYPATWLLLLFISWGDSSNLRPEAMHNCYFKLLCQLNNIEEFQRLGEEIGDEMKEKGWGWIKTVTGVEGPENTIENWDRYRSIVCEFSEEENRKQFNEFFQLGFEYWLEVCVNAFSERCKKAGKASEMVAEMFLRHFANGDCEEIDETDSKKNKKIVYG
ncbi:uncharacterized protein LOC129956594 [Argiope bruennichi]|uniref:uncharacterized protein LOC129956594 n=1 Tax=Argiope bruennichi TaxID=94029 RepID=UPI002494BF8D|nr:uncharacterized protein LOC129956594 [Argiope bruennichi]